MCRILALDGGGIKGTFTASALTYFEESLDRPLLDYFDLVVGTSTGGIIALGMACGLPVSRILNLYEERGPDIFATSKKSWLDWIFGTRYESHELRAALTDVFGERPFFDTSGRIAITSFDANNARPLVIKNGYDENHRDYQTASVVDIALATSAAPTYFPAAVNKSGVMLDGGVWANCPVMVGVVEAVSALRKRPNEIRLLSIGTTDSPRYVDKSMQNGGPIKWVRPVAELLMHAGAQGAIGMARKLCGKYIRIDEMVEPDRFELDRVAGIAELRSLGRTAAKLKWDEVHKVFFQRRAIVQRSGRPRRQPAQSPNA